MFLALGLGAYTAAMFHVMTHAFFKALLFLGSGSVIHACSGNQDIRSMGGLKKKLPITSLTFLIGCLAISGIFPLSGFFSKDEILAFAFDQQPVLWIVALLTAAMTAFYMFRLYYITFHGKFRGTKEEEHHLHESPTSMTIPLIVLAVLAVIGGFIGLPKVMGPHILEHYLENVLKYSSFKTGMLTLQHSTEWNLMGISLAVALTSIFIARYLYVKRGIVPEPDGAKLNFMYKLSQNKFYLDELYEAIMIKPLQWLSNKFFNNVELGGIDGAVNGTGNGVKALSSVVRLLQNGQLTFYVFAMVIGVLCILAIKFL
jgi:NADH-quinone oxidoreductase subunit L